MITIEPCCAHKHWKQVLAELKTKETVLIDGYGDMTLAELLPEVLGNYTEADVILAAPTLPESLCKVLETLLRRTWGVATGGNVNMIARLRLITDARASKSPAVAEWAKRQNHRENATGMHGGEGNRENAAGMHGGEENRVEVASCQQNDTMVIVTDGNGENGLAVVGPVNVQPCGQWTAMVTMDAALVTGLQEGMTAKFEAWRI